MLPDWILPSALRGVTWKSLEATRLKSSSLGIHPGIPARLLMMKPPCNAFNVGSSIWPAMRARLFTIFLRSTFASLTRYMFICTLL